MPAGFTSILWFTATITGAALNTSYGADACDHRVGNRESHTTREGVTTAYTLATAANEYATVGGAPVVYDAAGNLIQDEAGWQYVYDERSLLTQVKDDSGGVVANYTYDALGRRIIFEDVVAGTTKRYYYDGASLIQERNGSDVLTQYHVSGRQYIDERVATMDSGGDWIVHLMGNNFSVMGDGDDAGAITRTAYGTLGDFVDPPAPSDSGTFTLHGRPIDVLSDGTRTLVLMHVRARVYRTASTIQPHHRHHHHDHLPRHLRLHLLLLIHLLLILLIGDGQNVAPVAAFGDLEAVKVAARLEGRTLGVGKGLTALCLKLLDLLLGLVVPLVGQPLEEHEREDVGLVVLPGGAVAQDVRSAPQVSFELLLGQFGHG